MHSRKRNSNRTNALVKVLSDQELGKSVKGKNSAARQSWHSVTASPEPPEEAFRTMGSPTRWPQMLNLQIPSSSPSAFKVNKKGGVHRPNQSTKLRPHAEINTEERTSDLTKTLRVKNTLLAKVTALQQKINGLKTSNKELKGNLSKIKKLEQRLADAYKEREILASNLETEQNKVGSLDKNMKLFRKTLMQFLNLT